MQGPVADKVADIGRDPIRAGLDELIVVKLPHVFFERRELPGERREKRPQRLALLGIPEAIDRRQQRIETFRRQRAHAISSSRSNGAGSSVRSSEDIATPVSTRMRDASSRTCSDATVCCAGRVPP
ncbi:hypothetical protein GALL_505870 [mine drainage metagenome]|uniref:Uncharacterized protein n=1 Tax=mine drainage metagenome TaxID=410659 RepID=A0A1J5PJ96_9ZZZZ